MIGNLSNNIKERKVVVTKDQVQITGFYRGEFYQAFGKDELEAELNETQAMIDIFQIQLVQKKRELGYAL